MEVLKASAVLNNLELFLNFIKQFNKKKYLSESISNEIILVAEEVIVNIMNYAYTDNAKGELEISLSLDDNQFTFIIIDSGSPFDITKAKDPDVTLNVDERSVGGVGIFLVKHIMDVVSYDRKDDKNILTLVKML